MFFSVFDCLWLAPAALALDLVLGDPPLPWRHPVCYIGNFLNMLEKPCRSFMDKGKTENSRKIRGRLAGFAAVYMTAFLAASLVMILINLPWVGLIFAIYFAWAGLAMGCLLQTGRTVLARIESGTLAEGREGVSWLVSRDVSRMDQQLLRKTLADTLSENYTDAFLAPFFWLLIGGPAALWFYKAISTADSQWGYLTPRWKNPGFAAAKTDDLLAWLPARLSSIAFFISGKLGSIFFREDAWHNRWPGFRTLARQATGMPSPNSGWSMTACAWLCGCRMAGPSIYFGELVNKPWLGAPAGTPWTKDALLSLCRLLFFATITGGLILWLIFAVAALIV